MRTGLPAISWMASGYTSADWWVAWVLYGVLAIPLALFVWLAWRVFKSGPRPGRDAALTWVMLGASALCAGIAYPHDPAMLIPALLAAVLAAGCSVRVGRRGKGALLGLALLGWVLWLPVAGVLAIALR